MKHNLNNNKKDNVIASAILFTLATILVIAGAATAITTIQSAEANLAVAIPVSRREAPAVVSGDNIYVAWFTNNTANNNNEVMFRASTDGGATFSDKINLSNTTDADSWRVEIAGEGDTVVVSWWETNQTTDIPVARISTDAGETFGPLVMLAANGTLGSGEAEEIAVAGEGGGEEG
jgi:hypothetical protein